MSSLMEDSLKDSILTSSYGQYPGRLNNIAIIYQVTWRYYGTYDREVGRYGSRCAVGAFGQVQGSLTCGHVFSYSVMKKILQLLKIWPRNMFPESFLCETGSILIWAALAEFLSLVSVLRPRTPASSLHLGGNFSPVNSTTSPTPECPLV
ncbi:hypothetical protein N7G274_010452 [Stereocaulon virgatum]|uniref:Uncharacterized protein n=1 Tax=Stereocaulon virgatum TaxID=373712 RepID=A0ABR3ZTI0_9LECA